MSLRVRVLGRHQENKALWTNMVKDNVNRDWSSMHRVSASLHQFLYIYNMGSSWKFYGFPGVCMNRFVIFALLFGSFPSVCLYWPNTKCLFLFYHVLFYYIFYPLEGCLLSNVRQKGGLSRLKGWRENWKRRGRENHNLDLLCQEKNLFSNGKR